MTYRFVSHWNIDKPIELTKQAIYDVDTWQHWWPGLAQFKIIHKTPEHIGSIARMKWLSPSGYVLDIAIAITNISNNGDLHFSSTGDLVGHGSWHFTPASNSTDMIIRWNVAPTKPWMRFFNPILKPVFIASHDQLMKDGERGLASYLKK